MDEELVRNKLKNSVVLVTGGAGFIGSNLCDYLVNNKIKVICLDNFSTGNMKNIIHLKNNDYFKLIEGDIRNLDDCNLACEGADYVLHQAALGSVPRSINDPITTNEVNISGFLNMLTASRDNQVKRFIYAASSSTYGDSKNLPKVESIIGKPLSPYAITKYVNELYSENFKTHFDLDTIGLRYFNVFGRRQDPYGAYAAVIPKFVMQLKELKSPTINGDGSYSRDFTYIDNVIQANILSIISENDNSLNQIYNIAYGAQTTLNELVFLLKKHLSKFDDRINDIWTIYGDFRKGDVPHSLASIKKANDLLSYKPMYDIDSGLNKAITWYYNNL